MGEDAKARTEAREKAKRRRAHTMYEQPPALQHAAADDILKAFRKVDSAMLTLIDKLDAHDESTVADVVDEARVALDEAETEYLKSREPRESGAFKRALAKAKRG